MDVKHCIGLIAIFMLVNVQVQGFFLNEDPAPPPAAAVERAFDDRPPRDGVTCLSPDDCLADECCLANVRPIAKRSARTKRWFFESAPTEGVCQRLGIEGSACIVPLNGIFPDATKEVVALDVSPCSPEFICVAGSDAPVVVSQGNIGACELKPPEAEKTLLQLLNDKEQDGILSEDNNDNNNNNDNNDEEQTDDAAPSENDNADNDDSYNNDNNNNDNNNNYEEEQTDDAAPSENDNADNDDSYNNADETEPVSEEKQEDGEEAEKAEEDGEEEKPLENTADDFPADSEEQY